VLLKIVYLLTCRVLGLAVLVFRGDLAKDAELLVLWHENAVLRRPGRPGSIRADRPGSPRPDEDWIAVPVPPIVSEETFAQVQAKLDGNQQGAARNTRHEYLLRALISCGACRLGCIGRQTAAGYRYYLCRAAPTRCGQRRGTAAPPATSPPGSWMSWSRPTCAHC
jgi:hypothetical protein